MLLGMKTGLLGALFTELKELPERVSKLCQGLQPLSVVDSKEFCHTEIISYYDISYSEISFTIPKSAGLR
jgi:hypothetical protein